MNDKEKKTKKELGEIIKKGVEKELMDYDSEYISDEEMLRSGKSLPPEEILEKIRKKIKKEKF